MEKQEATTEEQTRSCSTEAPCYIPGKKWLITFCDTRGNNFGTFISNDTPVQWLNEADEQRPGTLHIVFAMQISGDDADAPHHWSRR